MKQAKRLILFFLAICFGNISGHSQNFSPLYLITLEGDTITGSRIRAIGWDEAPEVTSHFIVTQADGAHKTWEAKSIRQYVMSNSKRFYAKKWPHNGMRQFLEPQEKGKAQLFVLLDPVVHPDRKKRAERVVFDPDFKASTEEAYYISTADTELLIRVERDNYDLLLKQMLKDCPEVTEKIGQKKFRFNQLDHIVATYNETCQ